jgi:hypothetical protein
LYFTILSNNVAAALVVRTSGTVECYANGSTAFVSLDGVMFPTVWNRSQWIVPEWDNNWIGQSGFPGDFVYVWTRDDGLSYITGRMLASASGGGFLVVPERARIDREGVLLDAFGFGISRYELGRPSNGAWMTYNAGGLSATHQIGGMTWFANSGRHLESRWIDLPFDSNGQNFDTNIEGTRTYQKCQYMKDHHGVVWLRGLADTVTSSAPPNLLATLPVGYRPVGGTVIFSKITSADVQGRIDVTTSGQIQQIIGTDWINLTGIHFRAEA